MLGDVAAVAVDSADRVYLFTRGGHPVIVLDCEGNILRTWGHGMFQHSHGLHIGADEAIYCTDDGDMVCANAAETSATIAPISGHFA